METDMIMLAGATVIGGILGIYSTLRLIYYIFYMIANWRIFSKAGEPGWKSLIPFYNVYTEYKLQSIWTRFRLWRRTFFLQPIFSMILGFGSDQYQGNQS